MTCFTEFLKAQSRMHENVRTSTDTSTLFAPSLNPWKRVFDEASPEGISRTFYSAHALLHMPSLKAAGSCAGAPRTKENKLQSHEIGTMWFTSSNFLPAFCR